MTDTLATLTVADVERRKLQKHFDRFDILFFLVCTIVGVDTIATVAQGGGEAFTWMMIFAVVFFVPQALLFAELGTAFPQEGGPYYWTRLAFGHLAGAVNNFLYWITNPVWIGGTLAIPCIGAVEVFFNHGNAVPTAVGHGNGWPEDGDPRAAWARYVLDADVMCLREPGSTRWAAPSGLISSGFFTPVVYCHFVAS